MNTFENIIRDYLKNEAQNDPAFAEKWNKRKAEDDKVIEGCCSYIMAEAKKKAKNGCTVMTDAEVFGLAIHYIQEDIKAPEKKVQPAKVNYVAPTPKAEVPKPAPAPVKPKRVKDEGMMSLFNFDEE